MLTSRQVAEFIYSRVCGTCEDTLMSIDYFIQDGEIEKSFYKDNEAEILNILDSLMFSCEQCEWNYEICEMSEKDMVCNDCA